MEGDNEISFITLKAATLNVLRWLEAHKEKAERRECQPGTRDSDEKKCRDNARNIDQKLNEERAVGK
jgi:hypothetical protein